ncbi:MAG: hypothetical protein GSR77_00085 [Desulfurococcales archaeon]|nr:hypothetical protein [Desulfurococcales archaeon]
MKNTARILELAFSTVILGLSLYALYVGPGTQLIELASGRIELNPRPLAILGTVIGSLLLLDTVTGLLARLYFSRPRYKELLVAAIPFYMIGVSLELLVIVRLDLDTFKFAVIYLGGLLSLETAFWLTAQGLVTSPLSVEIRRRGLENKIPWYHRLSYFRIRGIAPVLFISDKLAPLSRRLYRIAEEALLPYTERELGLLLGSLLFLSSLVSIGLIIALYPWIGYMVLIVGFLPLVGLATVPVLIFIKREDRKEEGKENALWLVLAGRLASRLGLMLHTIFPIAGLTKETIIAGRYLDSGKDPLQVLERHPCRKIQMIAIVYKDIITAGGDPEPVLRDYETSLLEEHEQRMRRMSEEALTLLEAILILLGLGPLIALLAGSLAGNLELLRLYTSLLLPLGIVGAGILASRLPSDKASIEPGDGLLWLLAGAITGVAISLVLRLAPGPAFTLTALIGLLAYMIKHNAVLDAARADKEEAPMLLRLLAESARSGMPLISLLEQRASTVKHYRLRQFYVELLGNLKSRGILQAETIHEAMDKTLKLARLLYETGATAYDIEQAKRYIQAVLNAEKEARARLRILIALIPILPFILLYSVKLGATHILSFNTAPIAGVQFQAGPVLPWNLIETSIGIAALGIGLIAGRIYYGRWDNVRLALLSVASALLALFLV